MGWLDHLPTLSTRGRIEAQVREAVNYSLVDILSGAELSTVQTEGNQYLTRAAQVSAAKSMYSGAAQWGPLFMQRIINVRKAMAFPGSLVWVVDNPQDENGEKIYTDREVDAAEEVIDRMVDANGLNTGKADAYAKSNELEGSLLLQLVWDEAARTTRTIFRGWEDYLYVVSGSEADPSMPVMVSWQGENDEDAVVLELGQFVFMASNTCAPDDFEGVPTVAPVLSSCEDLHKSSNYWSRFNSLFAKVIPQYEAEDKIDSDRAIQLVNTRGWKLGDAWVGKGKWSMVGPQATGVYLSLRNEIVTHLQIIAGTTGVGPQHLGFPELMSNRSTAEEMAGMTELVAASEVKKWEGFWQTLFDSAILHHNANTQEGAQLPMGVIKPNLSTESDSAYNRAAQVWIPAWKDGGISLTTFHEKLPSVDPELEAERMDAEGGVHGARSIEDLPDELFSGEVPDDVETDTVEDAGE